MDTFPPSVASSVNVIKSVSGNCCALKRVLVSLLW